MVPDTFAEHLNSHLIGLVILKTRARTFEFLSHFVECDTVTVSPNQTIIILIIGIIIYCFVSLNFLIYIHVEKMHINFKIYLVL